MNDKPDRIDDATEPPDAMPPHETETEAAQRNELRGVVQLQRAADIGAGLQCCRICGCTPNAACTALPELDHESMVSCWWVQPDLCSSCASSITASATEFPDLAELAAIGNTEAAGALALIANLRAAAPPLTASGVQFCTVHSGIRNEDDNRQCDIRRRMASPLAGDCQFTGLFYKAAS